MGISAHVCSKYQVEYGNPNFHKQGYQALINHLLYTACGSLWYDGCDVGSAESIEVSRSELKELVEDMTDNPQDFKIWADANNVQDKYNEIVFALEDWLKQADPHNEIVRVEWF